MSLLVQRSACLTLCTILLLRNCAIVRARNVPDKSEQKNNQNEDIERVKEIYPVATTERHETPKLSRYEQGLEDYDEAEDRIRQARARRLPYRRGDDGGNNGGSGLIIPDNFFGPSDDHDHDHYHDHPPPTMAPPPPPPPPPPPVQEQKAIVSDPWVGYYNFLINEGSWKFWAAFQLGTAVLLFYSACAAAYYAKYNFITADYDYGDYIFGRSLDGDDVPTTVNTNWFGGLTKETFQRILDAITSKKYT